jgi:uncharacterized protein
VSHDDARGDGDAAVVMATLRFHAELNAFLPATRRDSEFRCACAADATVKHVIEALGVPHTEIGLVVVDGAVASLGQRVREGARIAVYPAHAATETPTLPALPVASPMSTRFIADAQLGALARLLRLAGFDTRYENSLDDTAIVAIARREGRCVLSRDVDLLKRRDVQAGCYVRALKPQAQLQEIVHRLGLAGHARPFSRCLACNEPLRAVAKADVVECLPQSVGEQHERFTRCDACGRVYWEGSHWQRMRQLLQTLLHTNAM